MTDGPILEEAFSLTEAQSEQLVALGLEFSRKVEALVRTAIAANPVANSKATTRAQILGSIFARVGLMAAATALDAEFQGSADNAEARVRFLSFVAGAGYGVSDGLQLYEMDPDMEAEATSILWKAIKANTETNRAANQAQAEAVLKRLFGFKPN